VATPHPNPLPTAMKPRRGEGTDFLFFPLSFYLVRYA
jgi:hypothetical protein